MTTPLQSSDLSTGLHLPGELAEKVIAAEKKLKPKGVSRNQLLADAIAEGLPAVIKRLSQRKNRLSLLECVEAVVRTMNGDITRSLVIDALKRDHAAVIKKYAASTLSANVAAYLRRLKERDVLEDNGTTSEKGTKGFRAYEVNVYRLKVAKA